MSNLAQKFLPEEPPTRPVENVPSQALSRVRRIEAHAESATTRLLAEAYAEQLAEVFADLSAIRSLCNAVLR